MDKEGIKRWKTIWVSDVHLGSNYNRAVDFLEFLKKNDAEIWYLVGDIIDGWAMAGKKGWESIGNDIIQKLLRKSRKGARLVYIHGNHDDFLETFVGYSIGNIDIKEKEIYTSIRGKKYMVIHGHQFDVFITKYRWIAIIGGQLHNILLQLGHIINNFRKRIGMGHISLCRKIKQHTKNAMKYVCNYESVLKSYGEGEGCDGIICGHIHHANIVDYEKFIYMNDGDWQEDSTFLAEDMNGEIKLYRFTNNEISVID